jgi:hypothetical protein
MEEEAPQMESETTQELKKPRRFQFSILSLLLLMAVVGLSFSLVSVYSRLREVERQLTAMQPMTAGQVAERFEANTTIGPVTTKVLDVRFSPKANAYRVDFSWTDRRSGGNWNSAVTLKPDGFGTYSGPILDWEYLQATGVGEVYVAAVKTPSPLTGR